MTYCVGIKVNEGMVFASDRRTNAGLDNFNSYSKMYVHNGIDRNIIILTITALLIATNWLGFISFQFGVPLTSHRWVGSCRYILIILSSLVRDKRTEKVGLTSVFVYNQTG